MTFTLEAAPSEADRIPDERTDRRPILRWLPRAITVAVVLALTASSLFITQSADAQGVPYRNLSMELDFLGSINHQRAARGISPLSLDQSMTTAAAKWTHSMTAGSFLAHARDITSGTPADSSKVAESVGRGRNVSTLTKAFMDSSAHRHILLDPDFTHVGIAVYIHPTGEVYTTHRFAVFENP